MSPSITTDRRNDISYITFTTKRLTMTGRITSTQLNSPQMQEFCDRLKRNINQLQRDLDWSIHKGGVNIGTLHHSVNTTKDILDNAIGLLLSTGVPIEQLLERDSLTAVRNHFENKAASEV